MKEVTSTTSAALTSGSMEAYGQGNTASGGGSSSSPKKICCACPDTRKLRDECIVAHGEDACSKWIDAHKTCLRREGFKI